MTNSASQSKNWITLRKLIISILPACILWLIDTPGTLSTEAWHLFAIFVSLIIGLILQPVPMAATALTAAAIAIASQTVTYDGLFRPFSQPAIWLILFAFFLSVGFIKTRLSERISYHLIARLGKSTIGLSYGLILSELILSPFIPSVSARSGGVIYPIASALSKQYSTPEKKSQTSKFLLLTSFHMSSVCGAMTLTAMAGNPIMIQMAQDMGINVSWGTWALAACVPGLISIIVVPWALYFVLKPEIKYDPEGPTHAHEKLHEMGPMKNQERHMLLVFLFILVLWVLGPSIGIGSTVTVMMGLGILELIKVIEWEDCLKEKAAWNAFLWMGILLGMGGQLKQLGFFNFIGDNAVFYFENMHWQWAFLLMGVIYYYSHYFFASNIGHIAAMYVTFIVASTQIGAPPVLAVLVFAFLSNLFGGLTHYSSGPAAIYFGSGYVSLAEWWKIGFLTSLLHLSIWLGLGMLWWKAIGLY
jgi:DASS family divalent anion:Na+ symporter